MKIDKAIEISRHLLQTSSREKSPDSWDAMKLGNEALKRIRSLRTSYFQHPETPLPGETKD